MDLDETNYVDEWRKRYDKFDVNSHHHLAIETTLRFVEREQREKLRQGLIDKQQYHATLDKGFDFLLSFFSMNLNLNKLGGEKYLIWKHQDDSLTSLLYSEDRYIKTEVERHCEEYILSSEYNISYIDWLILDVLTYLELKAFVSEMHKKRTGILGMLAGLLTKNYETKYALGITLGFILEATVNIIIPLSSVTHYLLNGGGTLKMYFAALCAIYVLAYSAFLPNRISKSNRIGRLTEAMIRVYFDLSGSVISMRPLKIHLDEAVKEGVLYNHSVFVILSKKNRDGEKDWFSPFFIQ
jgi:hypothetical protein